jgi:lipopolysaccharide biosynthesis glycosyltransferase
MSGSNFSTLSPSASNPLVVNVATAGDECYLQHLSVMLCSLFAKNQHHIVNAFVIVPKDTQECLLEKVRNSIPNSYSRTLQFCRIHSSEVDSAKAWAHTTSATYFKLLMGEILPPDIRRVLYLDPDIIVRGDIKDLWNHPIDLVGAVPDTVNPEAYAKLEFPPNEPYFNAGVLLIDLDQWRAHRIGERALDFTISHPDRITFVDQCGLNWVLRGRWTPLPERWNLQSHTLASPTGPFPREAKMRVKAAAIVHFTGDRKPWLYMTNHPVKQEYFSYLSRTEWKSYKYPDFSVRNVILKYAWLRRPGIRTMLSHTGRRLVRKLKRMRSARERVGSR